MGSHSSLYVWVHAVWHTKKNAPFLRQPFRAQLIHHIIENARDSGIQIDRLNGVADHLHCLIRLKTDQQIGKLVGRIKGESSSWVNRNALLPERFAWQTGFAGFSVSRSQLNVVRRYIDRQEVHHSRQGTKEELSALIMAHEDTPDTRP